MKAIVDDDVCAFESATTADPNYAKGWYNAGWAAERTGDSVGDGTSTATILAHAILVDGVRNVAAGASSA